MKGNIDSVWKHIDEARRELAQVESETATADSLIRAMASYINIIEPTAKPETIAYSAPLKEYIDKLLKELDI